MKKFLSFILAVASALTISTSALAGSTTCDICHESWDPDGGEKWCADWVTCYICQDCLHDCNNAGLEWHTFMAIYTGLYSAEELYCSGCHKTTWNDDEGRFVRFFEYIPSLEKDGILCMNCKKYGIPEPDPTPVEEPSKKQYHPTSVWSSVVAINSPSGWVWDKDTIASYAPQKHVVGCGSGSTSTDISEDSACPPPTTVGEFLNTNDESMPKPPVPVPNVTTPTTDGVILITTSEDANAPSPNYLQ